MATLVYHVAVSLDHFISDPEMMDGKIDRSLFLFEGDHVPDFLADIQQYAAVLMGRKTYEFGFLFGAKPGEPGYKGIKHYIFSNSLEFESNDEVELIQGDAVAFIRDLKEREDGKLWLCGGGELAGALLNEKLIDQLVLKVNPVFVGQGVPMFGSVQPRMALELSDLKRYSSGVLKTTYEIRYT
ncbi:dihydrofolate reductase family protein [Brevibacillus choshinensis]|uniref:dihydrofolate reductase family protein n=1 Tax=Brevibacillus choshinensis TaxID=54911 RepID=UPI002E1E7078|nr:dihydrofolate reductase family protein [Brevibacillus choshinensis]MED4783039.1 dihydrofolate reductase family protein [Brevibacillus choshinensis]